MEHLVETYPRIEICQTLDLSRSASYAHQHKPQKPRRTQDALLTMKIQTAFLFSRQTYGSPRLQSALREEGIRCGKNRINRLMKAASIRPKQKRKFRPTTTVSDPSHRSRIAPNHLAKFPTPDQPDQAWQSDITSIQTKENWLYLAGIIDTCSRKIVGYAFGNDLSTGLVIRAFEQACWKRKPARGLLYHSDRGCQYTSDEFQKQLNQAGMAASMSRKGNCYDNAMQESFWATLKAECFGKFIPETKQQAQLMIFDYIETFYNKRRKHSSLGMKSPEQFEALLAKNPSNH